MERIIEGYIFHSRLLVAYPIEKFLKLRRLTYISMLHTKCLNVLRWTPFDTTDVSFFGLFDWTTAVHKAIPNFIQIHSVVQEMKQTDTPLPLRPHFMHFLPEVHIKPHTDST